MKEKLVNLLFFFSFFPFLKIIPVITAEVQPISGILAFLILCLYGVKKNLINYLCFILIFIILFYSLISVLSGIQYISVALQVVAYTSSILIFIVLKDNLRTISKKVLIVAFSLYIITGILQELNVFGYVIYYLRLNFLIPRISGGVFGGSRGVSFLSPEPSHSARIIFQMLATILLFRINWLRIKAKNWQVSKKEFILYIVSVIFMLTINRSGTGILVLFIFSIAYGCGKLVSIIRKPKLKSWIWFVSTLSLVILLTALLVILSKNYYDQFRFLGLINLLTESDFWNLELPRFLALLGGKRFLTVIIGYNSLLNNFGLGHGVASYKIQFSYLAEFANIDLASIKTLPESVRIADSLKPDSYASSLAMDTGLIGLTMIIVLLIVCYFQNKSSLELPDYVHHCRFALYAVAVFMILFYSSSAFPVPWVILAYVCSGFPYNSLKDKHKK